MLEAVKRCMICKKPITPSFWLCVDCEERREVAGVPYSEWPSDLREMGNAHRRQRYLEQERLAGRGSSESIADLFDMVAYGAPNTDLLPDDPQDPGDIPDQVRGHTLEPWINVRERIRCVGCGEVFIDKWPTWPKSPNRWMEPVCPNCGIVHYEELGNQADGNGETSARDTAD